MKVLLAPCAVELHQPIEKYRTFTRDEAPHGYIIFYYYRLKTLTLIKEKHSHGSYFQQNQKLY